MTDTKDYDAIIDTKDLLKKVQSIQMPIPKETMSSVELLGKAFSKYAALQPNLTSSLNLKLPEFELPSQRFTEIDIPRLPRPTSYDNQIRQNKLLQQMVTALEAQNAENNADFKRLVIPTYNAKTGQLIFANTVIDIPSGDQQDLCKILFKKSKPSKPVNIGDALMKMDIPMDNIKGNKKVHYTKAHLNDTVAKAVQVSDLVIIEKKKVSINKKYQ
jgi:hypothetical protein